MSAVRFTCRQQLEEDAHNGHVAQLWVPHVDVHKQGSGLAAKEVVALEAEHRAGGRAVGWQIAAVRKAAVRGAVCAVCGVMQLSQPFTTCRLCRSAPYLLCMASVGVMEHHAYLVAGVARPALTLTGCKTSSTAQRNLWASQCSRTCAFVQGQHHVEGG